jgi:hypothetical protein
MKNTATENNARAFMKFEGGGDRKTHKFWSRIYKASGISLKFNYAARHKWNAEV